MKTRLGIIWIGVLVLGWMATAQATLIDRGGGLIYDSDQNLTWLQDANYAQTSGFDSDGRMNWDTSMAWAAGLSYGGYDDWRLPTVVDTGTSGCDLAHGGTDCGYNVDTATGELAYMFHVNLGNESAYNPDGSNNSDGCQDSFPRCLQNTSADGVDILNLQSDVYWSSTEYAPSSTSYVWLFHAHIGYQNRHLKGNQFYAWAVRSGDVAASVPEPGTSVPEPGTLLLLAAGLVGLAGERRRRC